MVKQVVPKGVWGRARGLKRYRPDEPVMLVLTECRSVHTFGMKGEMDLWGLDANGVVIERRTQVGRGKVLLLNKGVKTVVECYSNQPPEFKTAIEWQIREGLK